MGSQSSSKRLTGHADRPDVLFAGSVLRGLILSFHCCKAFGPDGTACRLREDGQLIDIFVTMCKVTMQVIALANDKAM